MSRSHARNVYMWRIFFAVFIICGGFILSGCTLNSGGTSSSTKYYTGIEGVVLEFMRGNPTSVYESEEFSTIVTLRNKGASDVAFDDQGKLSISYDDFYLSMDAFQSQRVRNIALEGQNQDNPVGGEEYYEFYFKANTFTTGRESIKTQILYSLCYPYRSEWSLPACIDTKLSDNDVRPAACTSKTYTSSGQGGPVVLTKIVPEMRVVNEYTIKPIFKVYVENKGKGYVVLKNKEQETCFMERDPKTLNKIKISGFIAEQELECLPNELTLVDDKEQFVTCSPKDVSRFGRTEKNYVTPLTIIAEYGYVETYKQPLEVIRLSDVKSQERNKCGYFQVLLEDGSCMDRCEYCSTYLDPERCSSNIPSALLSNQQFSFSFSGYSCSCKQEQCTSEAQAKGNCIPGYCTGQSFCCTSNIQKKVEPYQVLVNGKALSKCEYCALTNDAELCKKSGTAESISGSTAGSGSSSATNPTTQSSTAQFAGFSCTQGSCTQQDVVLRNCVPGFCPSGQKCEAANRQQCAQYQVESGGKCIDKCEYCATNAAAKKNDPLCTNPVNHGAAFFSSTSATCIAYTAETAANGEKTYTIDGKQRSLTETDKLCLMVEGEKGYCGEKQFCCLPLP